MWRLLQTEILYNRVLLTVLWVIFLPLLTIFALFGGEEIVKSQPGIMGLMWALSVVFSVFYMMDMAKTRRSRLFLSVPLKPTAVSGARILIFLLFWGSLSAGFWTVHLLFHARLFEWETLFAFLSLTGTVIFIHACYMLARDVKYTLTSRRIFRVPLGELIGGLLPAVLLILFVVVFFGRGTFADKIGAEGQIFFASLQGGVLFLMLGLTLSILDIVVFSLRRFFTE